MSVFQKLSLGRVAGWVARSIGWSPTGKSIVIYSAEGPSAHLFSGLKATVRSADQTTMILEVDRAVGTAWDDGAQVRLLMRHTGWTPFSMLLGPIAVIVQIVRPDGQAESVAIALAAVDRERERPP